MSHLRASVLLNDVRVGELRQDDLGYIEFHLDRRWQSDPDHPVLGQWFEERPHKRQRGNRPGDLPPYFANLIAEGDLGVILRERLGIRADDDIGLLIATGEDLPGAVVVRSAGDDPPRFIATAKDSNEISNHGFRFSLAGMQLKLSMLRSGDRFTFPGVDERGNWIVKIAREQWAGLCENEFVTMEWARRAGFDVPFCEIRTLAELPQIPVEGPPEMPVFAIRRYDRDGQRRIHQEDFMQVLGYPNWPTSRKYNDATYDQLASLVSQIVAPSAFNETLRRIAFVVASGNNDAHLKNWSLLYGDGLTASLTPLYDQTFAGQWSGLDKELALNVGGTKQFAAIDLRRFRELAARCDRDPEEAAATVAGTIDQIASAWTTTTRDVAIPNAYRQALRRHWASVPLLAPHALLVA